MLLRGLAIGCSLHDYKFNLENPSKARQRFVDTIGLISAADWSKTLSNFENIVQTPFESAFEQRTTVLRFAKLKLRLIKCKDLPVSVKFQVHFAIQRYKSYLGKGDNKDISFKVVFYSRISLCL